MFASSGSINYVSATAATCKQRKKSSLLTIIKKMIPIIVSIIAQLALMALLSGRLCVVNFKNSRILRYIRCNFNFMAPRGVSAKLSLIALRKQTTHIKYVIINSYFVAVIINFGTHDSFNNDGWQSLTFWKCKTSDTPTFKNYF